ncbi:MAG: tetratricopeptide repeat protein, partial [Kofleriaceae bacterium]
ALAIATLRPLVEDLEAARAVTPELRGQALRLFADLAERAGDLAGAATALEGFAALADGPPSSRADASPTSRADAMYRAGELFRRAESGDDAIRCLEAALRISDTHLPALDALEAAWRERGDIERVSVILGRKVAATARHPARQKPLLSRLGDLQSQLGRPDVALATHQRALEIDPTWRPSLRYVTVRLRDAGQVVAAAGGLAQLAGELPNDSGVEVAIVMRERQIAAVALAELVLSVDEAQLEAIREVARPTLDRTSLELSARQHQTGDDASRSQTMMNAGSLTSALARLRGELPRPVTSGGEENTASGRITSGAAAGALSLRDAAVRARAAGKLDEALATLETANHVSPGDPSVLRELVDLAGLTGDHEAAARHLAALAELTPGTRRGDVLLELADLAYDKLDDGARGREAMRAAADAFGSGARRDATLRMLANEAATHLAWNIVVESFAAIAVERRSGADVRGLAIALARSGREVEGIAVLEDTTMASRFQDGGELLAHLRSEAMRKAALSITTDAAVTDPYIRIPRPPEDPATISPEDRVTLPVIPMERSVHDAITEGNLLLLQELAPARTKTSPGIGESIDKAPASPGAYSITRRRDSSQPPATTMTTRDWPAVENLDEKPAPDRTREPTQPPLARLRLVTTPTMPAVDPETEIVDDEMGFVSVSDPMIASGPVVGAEPEAEPEPEPVVVREPAAPIEVEQRHEASVVISGSPSETATALALAAASADRDRLLAARHEQPDDPSMLAAVLAHFGDREPTLRREILDEVARIGTGRALAIALHELALLARESRDGARAATLWTRAYAADPDFPPVWMHLADVQVSGDDLAGARELYERVADSEHYDATRRAFAEDRARALGHDEAVVSGEIGTKPPVDESPPVMRGETALARARELADAEDWPGAIAAAEAAAASDPSAMPPLELLERVHLESGDITAASEAIGRQLLVTEQPAARATLWRRRARLYRDTLGRDAEAYRCLKEAHACSPVDPEIAYQLRTAAMVRGEWALAASLLYREIASAATPRDRGALHLELALIYEERLDDEAQAQVNFEQALAFDPTIPAAKLPLARRYETVGRYADAARLFEEAAASARAGDRAGLLDAAARARSSAAEASGPPDLAAQLDRAEAMGDLDAALDLAHRLWRTEPGHPAAFRVLANLHRTSGDLAALTELTSIRATRAKDPDDRATAWLEVARLGEDVGALDQAARAYDLALIEDPGHVGALDARGALAFRLGDFATADLIYRDLGSGESVLGDDELAIRRSIIAEQLGRDTEALAHAKAAAEAAPGRRDVVMRVQELATRCGDLETALTAARAVLDLVPLDDDEGQLTTHFALVDLQRQAGNIDAAVSQLERILRDHPLHAPTLEALAELQIARADWPAATRYLYQLVPLAPSPRERAERLYRLGEAVLTHLGDADRADDVFLRASDLDPSHIPTLRRLLDVYWRADDPGALVEVATELAQKNALEAIADDLSLAHALVAAALVGDTALAQQLGTILGDAAPGRVADALAELAGRQGGRLQLASASTAILELARRGMLDLTKVRAAAAGTPVAGVLH